MKRVLIFLILTLACAFGSYTSFMSNDYGPLKHWMAYYIGWPIIKSIKKSRVPWIREMPARPNSWLN